MAQVLAMAEMRRSLTARKGFQSWTRRFSEAFDENTRLEDLSTSTLSALIRGGEDASMPLYEFILGVKGMGMGPRFYFMESGDQLLIMDVALFLLDQFRFEAMRRLGWVVDCPTSHVPMVDLVSLYSERFEAMKNRSPELSRNHHRYEEYNQMFEGDRSAFIRTLIPQLLDVFGQEEQK